MQEAVRQNDPIEIFKGKIKEQLQMEEYEGWIRNLEIHQDGNKIVFHNLSSGVFRDDIVNNHDSLFRELAQELWQAEKVLYQVGKLSKVKKSKSKVPDNKTTADVITFPNLPTPNHLEYSTELCRYTPFLALPNGTKRKYVDKILYKDARGSIRFKGILLDVTDQDTFLFLIKEAREGLRQGKENIILEFSQRQFLKGLGLKSGSGPNMKTLKNRLDRLTEGRIILDTEKFHVLTD
ncbi:MAG: hypothetical protein HQM14_20550 [SAR324 cluster bacterium]|nr:hypothetical protein [SAR324 cluster bacterium]